MRQATGNKQLQFYRQCDHPDAELHYFIHPDDHVDVFLDAFRMDHEVPLADRLEIEDYTISLSDVLLTKLQAAHMDEKDERDVISLLCQSPLGETDERGAINVAYIARLCAGEWGLYYDVLAGVAHMREVLAGRDDLDPALAERVRSSLDRLEAAIEARAEVDEVEAARQGGHAQAVARDWWRSRRARSTGRRSRRRSRRREGTRRAGGAGALSGR